MFRLRIRRRDDFRFKKRSRSEIQSWNKEAVSEINIGAPNVGKDEIRRCVFDALTALQVQHLRDTSKYFSKYQRKLRNLDIKQREAPASKRYLNAYVLPEKHVNPKAI